MEKPIKLPEDQPAIGFYETKPNAPPLPEEKTSTWETIKAGFNRDNDILNTIRSVSDDFMELSELSAFSKDNPKPDFNPLSEEYLSQVAPQYWPRLATRGTPGSVSRLIAKIDQENENRDIFDRGTVMGMLGSAAINGLTSPWSLVPIAHGAKLIKFGPAIASSFGKAIPGMAAGNLASELNLFFTQETRTLEEVAMNTLTGTLFGGALAGLGAGARTLKFKTYRKLFQEVAEKGTEIKYNLTDKGELKGFLAVDSSVGAQSTREINLVGESIYGWGKNGEISVAALPIYLTAKVARNPVFLGLTSKSASVRSWTNGMLEHNLTLTKNVVKGEFNAPSLQSLIGLGQGDIARANISIANHYYDYLDIPKDATLTGKALRAWTKKNGDKLSMPKFAEAVSDAVNEAGVHSNPHVSKAAKQVIKEVYEPKFKQLVELDLLPADTNPFGAIQYINRIYDRDYLAKNPDKAQQFLFGQFAATNDKIIEIMTPIRNLEARIADYKHNLSLNKEPKRAKGLQAQINNLETQLKSQKAVLQENIQNNVYSPDMLTGKKGMAAGDINTITKEGAELRKVKSQLKQLEEAYKIENRQRNAGRKPGEKNKPPNKKMIDLQKSIEAEKANLKRVREELNEKFATGKIDSKLGFRVLQNGEEKFFLKKRKRGSRKLRGILDEAELRNSAANTYDTIMGLNDEQLGQALFDNLKSGGGENIFMARALMIPDKDLAGANFLVRDIRKNVSAYVTRTSRAIEMQKYLLSNGMKNGADHKSYLAHSISEDYGAMRRSLDYEYNQKLTATTDPKLQAKLRENFESQSAKLTSEQKADISLVKNVYDRLMGTADVKYGKSVRLARFFKNWAYSTQLGALFLMCLQDSIMPAFRIGFKNHVQHGIAPFFANTLSGRRTKDGTKANIALRRSAYDLALGVETFNSLNMQRLDMGLDYGIPTTWMESVVEKGANAMGVLNMSNQWTDGANFIMATSSQSSLIRVLERAKTGKKIAKADLRRLQILGIDPSAYGDRILKEFAKHGEKLSGGYLPNWHLWNDKEAKQIFKKAVKQEVNSIIFSGSNIASYPVGLEPGGWSGALLMYMGWSFQATSNYLVPLLQEFDSRKIGGVLLAMSVASLVSPLRQIARGEQPELEAGELFKGAVLDSGLLGIYGDFFNKANAIGNIFPSLRVDRFADKGAGDMVGGSIGAQIDNLLKVTGMIANQEWNQADMRRVVKLVPLLNLIYLRYGTEKVIENLGLPKGRAAARAAAGNRRNPKEAGQRRKPK